MDMQTPKKKPFRFTKKNTLSIIGSALVLASGMIFATVTVAGQNHPSTIIDSFEQCAAANRPILTTYPEQCVGPDGRSFTKHYNG